MISPAASKAPTFAETGPNSSSQNLMAPSRSATRLWFWGPEAIACWSLVRRPCLLFCLKGIGCQALLDGPRGTHWGLTCHN